MNHWTSRIRHYNDLIYPWLTVAAAIWLLSGLVWPGLVQPYININVWLLFWSASAILKLILSRDN